MVLVDNINEALNEKGLSDLELCREKYNINKIYSRIVIDALGLRGDDRYLTSSMVDMKDQLNAVMSMDASDINMDNVDNYRHVSDVLESEFREIYNGSSLVRKEFYVFNFFKGEGLLKQMDKTVDLYVKF